MPTATIFDASTEAGDILATVAPASPDHADPLTIWALGAWSIDSRQGF